ncbi:DUF1501 domain-containing protein [bacterium]|nr:DUF1501 domain-containing protein [bacterium]
MKKPKQEIDRPITQLIHDLEKRGLLVPTLVIIDSEFCRDMIEGVQGSNAKDQSRLSRRPSFQHFYHDGHQPKDSLRVREAPIFLTKEVMGKPAMDIFT